LKSDAGERDLDLTPELAKVLRTHKLASSYAKDDDFVFTTLTGSRSTTAMPPREAFRRRLTEQA
jgi:hypothetical protein